MKTNWLNSVLLIFLLLCSIQVPADEALDGEFQISSVQAPDLVLEALNGADTNNSIVSIGIQSYKAYQIWVLKKQADDFYLIYPKHNKDLVLSVKDAGTENGSQLILETNKGEKHQLWEIRYNNSGNFNLIPAHSPTHAMDNLGGATTPGAKQDIWDFNPYDKNEQWILKPQGGAQMPKKFQPVPIGKTEQFTFFSSKIFPGTVRDVVVFIPAQYDGSKPACVHVQQDGYNDAWKNQLELLIGHDDIPVMVSVFITPGNLNAPDNSKPRVNRSFEYDGRGDSYARMVVEEILPEVSKRYNLNLSESGNDRSIMGGSSGGIAAFNASWERPDYFNKSYSFSGSYVSFRGGHELPMLVRKYEAKPIRTYQLTGTNDMVNCAGNWYLEDQQMDKALEFSGYDYVFKILEGEHGVGGLDYFADAMRFLWRDWPTPIKAGASAPRVRDVIKPDEGWTIAAENINGTSPVMDSKGNVYFINSDKISRIEENGKITAFAGSKKANGLAVGANDEIYSVSSITGDLLKYQPDGKSKKIASDIKGNYIMARPDGRLYVTTSNPEKSVILVQNGTKKTVDSGLKKATGLAYRPDQWLLAVADGDSKWAYSYQINSDGTLSNKERYFWLHVDDNDDDSGCETVCYAKEAQILIATRMGIQICADGGATQVILPLPDRSRVMGMALGGAEQDILYAFGGGKIWKRNVKIHGIGAFSPYIEVNSTPL